LYVLYVHCLPPFHDDDDHAMRMAYAWAYSSRLECWFEHGWIVCIYYSVDVDECHPFIWMKMNGCMVQLMDEIYSFGMNPTGIGIEIFYIDLCKGFPIGCIYRKESLLR
jgi:hypothetical protein